MEVGLLNEGSSLIFNFFFNFNLLLAIEFNGSFLQGSYIIGKISPDSKVFIDKTKVKVSKEGFFAFGIGRDRINDVVIKVLKNDKLEIIQKKIYKK